MKKSDIKIGKRYTDQKGNIREVIGEGPNYASYCSQTDYDCVRFRLIAKKRGPQVVGHEYTTTRSSFASWAKVELPAPVMTP
jgi:hypothetical protein